MVLLIVKDGIVVATHEPHQEKEVAGLYPGCSIVRYEKPFSMPKGEPVRSDPRTNEEKAAEYKDRRRIAYPAIEDQLDMIFWDKVNGTNKWVELIASIKNTIRP